MKEYQEYTYENVSYRADKNLISNYLRIGADKKIGLYIKGQESPYVILDKESKKVIYNQDIEKESLGMKGQEARIKACAMLNTIHDIFVKESGWTCEYESLGLIVCKESAVDNRKKDKIGVDSLIAE